MAIRFFRSEPCGLSKARLYVMRALYLLTGALFGFQVWTALITSFGEFEALEGVAYSYWGALCVLMRIGVRFPVKMLPVLLMQFLYKAIWLIFVGYPLLGAGMADANLDDLMSPMQLGVLLDIIAIPWLFVVRNYFIGIFRPDEP